MKYIKLFEEINVYHGSGKKFNDFNTTKMSKNSGQDTYGWGFYFTDSEDVAKIYSNEHDKSYVYHITLHKGKTPDQYDYLIFDENISISQRNKIQNGLNKENINFDMIDVRTGWDVIGGINKFLYENLPIEQRFNFGYNIAKKETSLFLLRCGIDGLKFKPQNNVLTHEYGYDCYNYVVFDEKNIYILIK